MSGHSSPTHSAESVTASTAGTSPADDPVLASRGVSAPVLASGGASAPGIAAVSVALKLPPFWPADPELWFAQVEAQFACRRITSQRSKFDYVVSSLAPEFAVEVRDLLIRPPSVDPYKTLKAQLTKRTTASEQRKLQLLFTAEELGDRKPTQLLRRMRQLLGDRPGLPDDSFLRELFLQRLPPNVRMVLASTTDGTGLEQLADLADKVMEVASPLSTIASVSSPPTLTTEVDQLREEVSRLSKLVHNLSCIRSSSRSANRTSRRPSTPPANSANTSDSPDDGETLCWYHRKFGFGNQAQRCRSPCARKSNFQAGH